MWKLIIEWNDIYASISPKGKTSLEPKHIHTHTHSHTHTRTQESESKKKQQHRICWIRWIYVLSRNSNVSHKSHSSWTSPKQTFAQSLQIIILVFGYKQQQHTEFCLFFSFRYEKKKLFTSLKLQQQPKYSLRHRMMGLKTERRKKFPRIQIVKIKTVRIKREYVWKSLFERNDTKSRSAQTETMMNGHEEWGKQEILTRKNHNIELKLQDTKNSTEEKTELANEKTCIKLLLIEFDITSS